MSAGARGMPLICSTLLCALVISCGGPPVYVVAPVPAAAPGPQGGLQEAVPPPPVQAAPPPLAPEVVSPPAPRAAPPPKPEVAAPPVPADRPPLAVVPPRRPGGAPPGTERVTLPGGQVPLKDWLSDMDSACQDAHYQTGCLNLNKNFHPKNGPHPLDKCKVDSQSPKMGDRVTTSTPVTLNIECARTNGPDKSKKKDPSNETGPQGS